MRIEVLDPAASLEGENGIELIADVYGLVGVVLPRVQIRPWTKLERLLAYDWAIREHLRASDSLVRRRDRPSFTLAPGS